MRNSPLLGPRLYFLSIVLAALMPCISHAQTDIFFDGGPFYDDVMFDKDFSKGQGPFNVTEIISGAGLTTSVRIFLRNGGPAPAAGVSNGAVILNGQTIFGANDFKVENGDLFAVVTKEVSLASGNNTLEVQLKGGGTGTINLRILRPMPVIAGAIYVSSSGIDVIDCGSKFEPCATIANGIDRAVSTAGTQVLVANGVYIENVTVVDGIDLLGGFSSDFSRRDVHGTGTLVHAAGVASPTILANTITSTTVFEGFIVHGPSVTTPGENSIAMSLVDSTSALEVRDNVFVAGLAAAGADGSSGPDGVNGNDGQEGGSFQNGSTTIPGGAGGTGPSGAGGAGGAGGTSTPPVNEFQNGSGIDGSTSAGGAGGLGGFNGGFTVDSFTSACVLRVATGSMEGLPGLNGGSQSNGTGGDGGLAINGSGASGTWISSPGTAGAAGMAGSGGGGGGAGGGTESIDCNSDVTGPSGGGGGAGGGAGSGGSGGRGGGGAFAIFVFNGAPTITGNLIFLGTAGNGGGGGQGGAAGSGGQGAAGGICATFGCFDAGAGGDGGNGSHGGGGGGGAGGPSVGIFSNFVGTYGTTNTIDTSTGIAGFGGAGGQSLGADGKNGESGIVADVLF
jgi:hypothetical protein